MNEGIWQKVAFAMCGLVIGLIAMSFTAGRNTVTRDDLTTMMPGMISQYSPYTQDAKAIRLQLDDQANQIGELQAQIAQLDVDIARISDKLNVPAHPTTVPGKR